MEQQAASEEQRASSADDGEAGLEDEVTERAQSLAEQAQKAAESQKGRLAEGATEVARALHHASEGLRRDDQRTVGDYTEALAGQVEKVAQFLQSRDLPTMAREVSGFAKRQPALFLGGAFTLGIVAARFLKSSGGSVEGRPPTESRADTDDDQYRDRQEPDLRSPGGVPPLPSANGGGL